MLDAARKVIITYLQSRLEEDMPRRKVKEASKVILRRTLFCYLGDTVSET